MNVRKERGADGSRIGGLWRIHGVWLGGLFGLTIVYLWPAIRHFRSQMVAAEGDADLFLWSWWHAARALAQGTDPFRTNDIFYPVGVDLSFHTFAPLTLLFVWPIADFIGWAEAVNVNQLVATFLSGLGAYFLCGRVAKDARAAFFGAVAYAFLPFRFVHIGSHFNLIHYEVLPFGVLALLRAAEGRCVRRWALAGAVQGGACLVDMQYAALLAVAMVVLVARREGMARPDARSIAACGLAAVAVALPVLLPMARAVQMGELDRVKGWGAAPSYSSDVLSWVMPPPTHRLWGRIVAGVWERLPGGTEGLAFPGFTVLTLAVLGREWTGRARRRGWVALAMVAGVLGFGPYLQVGGRSGGLFHADGRAFALPLPFALVRFVPWANHFRVPGRFAILAALALVVLAGLSLADLCRRESKVARQVWWIATVLVLVEFLPGELPVRSEHVPLAYRAIAASMDERAVLEIPLQWSLGWGAVGDTVRGRERDDSIFVYYATAHGRKLVSGTTSRYPKKRLDRLTSVPLFRQVLSLQGEEGFDEEARFTEEDLCDLGIGFVVYHRDRPMPAGETYVRRLGLPVVADDGTVVVWRVADCGRDAGSEGEGIG